MSKQVKDTFIKAAKGQQTDYVPVWYMRQAGRSQPEYRAIKEKYSLFEITHQPELCAYVTKLPVDQYDVDAAVNRLFCHSAEASEPIRSMRQSPN